MTDFSDKEGQPISGSILTRRKFLGTLAAATGFGGAAKVLYDRHSASEAIEPQPDPPLEVPPFLGIAPEAEMLPAIDWTSEKVQTSIDQAIQRSLETGREILVELPEGEILIDKTITCTIPEGAKIKLRGHEKGSRLKLEPALSEISQEWGSFAQSSILYFRDMEGDLGIDGVQFDGSSLRAQERRDHVAAKSPWDALVLIVGKGEGEKYTPAMDRAGNRKGKAEIVNSRFYNSESGGVTMQNIHDAQFHDSQGSKLDVLFTSTWCDDVSSHNCRGEYLLSDGTYITSALNVKLENWQIKTARQAYDLQGVRNASLTQCHAYDSAFAFAFTLSETDKTTPSGKITVDDSHSEGCLTPFSIGEVQQLQVSNSNHNNVGEWYMQYVAGDFHHASGIVPLGNAITQPTSFISYGSRSIEGIDLENVSMRVSPNAPENFSLANLPGIRYTN
ncbi:MAG: hypothetical protein WBO77_04850 [Microgenomates group bacterium]